MSDQAILPGAFTRAPEQPRQADMIAADGIGIVQVSIPRVGIYTPQHSHVFDHITLLMTGAMRVWAGDTLLGDFSAPAAIHIRAQVKHTMLSLTDAVTFACVHRVDRTGAPEEFERHELVPACSGDCGRCSL